MQSSSQNFPTYVFYLAGAGFIVLWCLNCLFSSSLSGWRRLAQHFRARAEYLGETISTVRYPFSVCFRYWTDYSSILHIAADEDGLHLSAMFPFRPGHPPLLIPWREVEEQSVDGVWRSYVVLILGRTEQIPMRISKRLANDIRAARSETLSRARNATTDVASCQPTKS